jgi:pre-60S factor REI1
MSRFHGMFIPERDFLVEPENLIRYLHEKVHTYNVCLKCHKPFHSASGTQTHMRDRGHCMIAFESEDELVEIGEFYDFRSSYPDAEQFEVMEQEAEESDDSTSTAGGGGVKLGAPRKTVTSTADGDEEDEGWETDSTVSSVPTDEITAIPIDDRSHRYKLLSQSRHHSHKDPRPHRAVDGFHSHAHATPVAVYHDEYELHLPTGRTAGHRSLNKYYRQNLRNYPGVAERMEKEQRRITGAADDSEDEADGDQERGRRGRALIPRSEGGLGMIGVSDEKKARVKEAEKRTKKQELRAQKKHLDMRTTNQQKHFRVCVLSPVDVCCTVLMRVVGSFAPVVASCEFLRFFLSFRLLVWRNTHVYDSRSDDKSFSWLLSSHKWTLAL